MIPFCRLALYRDLKRKNIAAYIVYRSTKDRKSFQEIKNIRFYTGRMYKKYLAIPEPFFESVAADNDNIRAFIPKKQRRLSKMLKKKKKADSIRMKASAYWRPDNHRIFKENNFDRKTFIRQT